MSFWPDEIYSTNQKGGSLTVTASRSLFEVFNGLLAGLPARWEGTSNVYRIGLNPWIDPQPPPADGIHGLRVLLNSPEIRSVVADPLSYDPLQWRLLPDSPGAGEGPDGRDFGADVDRLIAGQFAASARETDTPADVSANVDNRDESALLDPSKPFVLISSDEKSRKPFDFLDEALLWVREGDVIEIHGNGPFRCNPRVPERAARKMAR